MSMSQVRAALGDPRGRLAGNEPDVCAFVVSAAIPDGVRIMTMKGRVVRVYVSGSTVKTASGVGIGAREDDVHRAYPGRITTSDHKYFPGGHYLDFMPSDLSDRGYGLRFETEGGRVAEFSVGTAQALVLVEGCA